MADGSNKEAIFAGGCFWCMEPPFQQKEGVISVVSGYTGGNVPDPSYEDVSTGRTGHYEAIRVTYDPGKITYRELLDVFWANIDPTDPGGQFSDRGSQYMTAVFYSDENEKRVIENSLRDMASSEKYDSPIVTKVLPVAPFYEAEEYHQDYFLKMPARYQWYKKGSGREDHLKGNS